jgi:hypothetical protein
MEMQKKKDLLSLSHLKLRTRMPSFSLNTSNEYDADGCDSSKISKANSKGKGVVEGAKASAVALTHTPKRGQLPQSHRTTQRNNECLLDLAKAEDSSEKRTSLTASRMKLRSSSKNKKEEDVIPSRSRKVAFVDSKFVPHESSNAKHKRGTPAACRQKSNTPPQLDAPVALYPPQPLRPPPKCPVAAIQHPLPLLLFDDALDSNRHVATLTNTKEPLSYAKSPPISPGFALLSEEQSAASPGIAHLSKEYSGEDGAINNEQIKKFSPTLFTSMQPLSVVEPDSPYKTTEASYIPRKPLFAGETGSPHPRVEEPNEDVDEAATDKRGEAYMSPNLTLLSDELSRVNFKSPEAQCKAPGTNESYEPALDDGVITRKMEILLDLSYLRSGVQLANSANTHAHKKRAMLILDNPTRAKLLISMILRNNTDIDLMDLMREFDYFSI